MSCLKNPFQNYFEEAREMTLALLFTSVVLAAANLRAVDDVKGGGAPLVPAKMDAYGGMDPVRPS